MRAHNDMSSIDSHVLGPGSTYPMMSQPWKGGRTAFCRPSRAHVPTNIKPRACALG